MGPGLGIQTSSDKIYLDNESLKGRSQYPNSDKSFKSLDTEARRYPNRGGGLGIGTSLDRICMNSKSVKGVSSNRTIRTTRIP